jgi:hypothetical protein
LILVPVISDPNIGYLIAGILVLSGLILYYPFVYRKVELPFMSECFLITVYLINCDFLEHIHVFIQVFFDLQKAEVNIDT